MAKEPEKLVFAMSDVVEGRPFKAGDHAGDLTEDKGLVPAEGSGLTRGHLEARFDRRVIVREKEYKDILAGKAPGAAVPGTPGPPAPVSTSAQTLPPAAPLAPGAPGGPHPQAPPKTGGGSAPKPAGGRNK